MNAKILNLPQSATVALADMVRALARRGQEVISLQTGDPDFPTPAPIIEAAYEAMRQGHTHYADSRGLPELRQALAEKIARENHGVYDPDSEFLICNGGVHALYCALKAIINSGDEVLVFEPAWMTYSNIVSMLGGVAVRMSSRMEDGFWPTIEDLRRRISPKTAALIVNSPNNPTGALAGEEYLSQVAEVAAEHDLFIISDEVYEYIIFGGHRHVSMARFRNFHDKIVVINSFSKSYSMTGWRIGYMAAPASVVDLALKAGQNTVTNVAPFVQKAALFALTSPEAGSFLRQMLKAFSKRRELALDILKSSQSGISVFEPKGAFYLFIDLRPLNMPSVQIASRMLSEKGISMVSGSAYGECGEGFLRMTFAAGEELIEKGLHGLTDWVNEVHRA